MCCKARKTFQTAFKTQQSVTYIMLFSTQYVAYMLCMISICAISIRHVLNWKCQSYFINLYFMLISLSSVAYMYVAYILFSLSLCNVIDISCWDMPISVLICNYFTRCCLKICLYWTEILYSQYNNKVIHNNYHTFWQCYHIYKSGNHNSTMAQFLCRFTMISSDAVSRFVLILNWDFIFSV